MLIFNQHECHLEILNVDYNFSGFVDDFLGFFYDFRGKSICLNLPNIKSKIWRRSLNNKCNETELSKIMVSFVIFNQMQRIISAPNTENSACER